MRSLLPAACLLAGALAQSESGSSGVLPTGSPTVVHSTAVPSPSLPADSLVPTQEDLPPKQDWCPSEIFCAGPVSSFSPIKECL
jgi:alpha,alpha-trehalase